MVARLLRDCGVDLGPDSDHPFDQINDSLIEALGHNATQPQPGWSDLPELRPFYGLVQGLLADLEGREPWGWHDPRTALTLEFWMKAVPDLRPLLVVEDPIKDSTDLWARINEGALRDLKPGKSVVVQMGSLRLNPYGELERALANLGVKSTEHQIAAAAMTVCAAGGLGTPVGQIPAEAYEKQIKILQADKASQQQDDAIRILQLHDKIAEIEADYGPFLGLGRMLTKLLPHGSLRRRTFSAVLRAPRMLVRAGLGGVFRIKSGRHSPVPLARSDEESLADQLECGIESGTQRPFEIGKPQTILLRGWCYHPSQAIRELSVQAGGVFTRIEHHSIARFDVLLRMDEKLTSGGNALNSGFWLLLQVSPESESIPLTLRAQLESGEVLNHRVGEITAVKACSRAEGVSDDLVAVCMTTFNPKPALFRKQIESIRNQTHRNWVCLVNDDGSSEESLRAIAESLGDDERFSFAANPERQGFYKNFETVLGRVPPTAAFVALSDQDDEWEPRKLERCLAAMRPEVSLAFSDMRLVDEAGQVLSNTYWQSRTNNFEHLDCLLLGNTITGAASLFRRDLLSVVLPFPDPIHSEYHDHWIATAALANGRVAYIPEPLYNYTQHEGQIVGRWEPKVHTLFEGIRDIVRWRASPFEVRANPKSVLAERAMHAWWPLRMAYWSSLLLERAAPEPSKARILRRYRQINGSPWRAFAVACIASVRGRATLGLQWLSFNGLLAQSVLRSFTIRRRNRVLDALRAAGGLVGSPTPAVSHARAAVYGNVRFIPRKTAPLTLVPSPDTPKRVNILASTIDFKYFFGGYFAVFSLALKLADQGAKVRLVLTDPVDYDPEVWREEIKKYHGLANFFGRVEVACCYDRPPLEVNPGDQFVATSWWAAFVAHQAVQELGRGKFIYLSQDFEPLFYPANSFYALALDSYSLPHFALFSSPLLQKYSKVHGIGVYANGTELGDANSVSFRNAIEAHTPTREQIARSGKKRLLFYSRPEDHANRNCFPLGVLALQKAIREGHFKPDEWELHGIGSVTIWGPMELDNGRQLHLLPKVSLEEYYALVPEYDIGLALMLTPHPSLMPLDMAASGLVTVTNTFDVKTQEELLAISSNLVPVEPTIEGIKAGLIEAAGRVSDLEARIAGANLRWPRTWDDAFDDSVMAKLKLWIEE